MTRQNSQKQKTVCNSGCSDSEHALSIDEEVFLQPWFVSKQTFLAIRRLLPSSQLLKMKYYFEDYGCLRCGKSNVVYRSNGLCRSCTVVVRARTVLSLKRRFERLGVPVSDDPIPAFVGSPNMTEVRRRAQRSSHPKRG